MPFPITVEELAKTEKKFGVVFPLGFKVRMARDNGGEIEVADEDWQLIPFFDGSDQKRAARTCNDICRETASMRSWRGFPADAYVIAQNGGGDCLILRPSEVDPLALGEPIYHWDHETGEVIQSLGEPIYHWDHETGEVTLVADSIQEL